jgi:hypothetical protein
MAISTNGTVLARVAGALYNTQMSNATYSEVKTLDPASLTDALYARDFANATDTAVATTLVTNLGLTSVDGLVNWVAAQLTAAGAHKGAKIVDLLNGFAQMSSDATYGAAATAFNTKVDAALVLSQTTGNAGGTFAAAGTVIANASFTLTTAVDTFTGDAGNDTFTADNTGTDVSSTADSLNGGAGTDTLNFFSDGAAGAMPNLTSIENVNVYDQTADLTISKTGVTKAGLIRGDGGLTLTIGSGVTTVDLTDIATVGVVVAANAAATTLTLNTSGITDNDAASDITVTGAALTNVTINATGSTVTDLIDVAAATSITINAAAAVTTTLATTGTAALVITGAGAVNLGTLDADVDTVTSTSTGKFTAAIGANVDTVLTSGAGNDLITASTADTIATTDTLAVNGGDGTDTLIIGDASDINTAADGARYTNFETIRTATTQDMSLVAGITALEVSASTSQSFTKLTATQAANVTAKGSLTTNTFALATATGTADELTLKLGDTTNTTAVAVVTGVTVTGFETVNIVENGDATATAGANRTAVVAAFSTPTTLSKINFSGRAGTLTDVATTVAVTVDGTVLTGDGATTSVGLTVGGSAVAGSSILGSAVKDVFTIGAEGSTYNGNAGNDTFTTSVAILTPDGLSDATLIGGAGNDTLTISDTAATLTDLQFTNVSGFEKLTVSTGDLSITSGAAYNAAFATGNTITTGTLSATKDVTLNLGLTTAAQKITVDATSLTGAATETNSITTGSGADTVTFTGDDSYVGVAGAAPQGTIVINTRAGDDTISVTVGVLDSAAATSGQAISITAGTGADTITKVGTNDTVVLGVAHFTMAAGDSATTAWDKITGFDVADGTLLSDVLNFDGTAAVSAFTATEDVGVIKSHSITAGYASFDDVADYSAALVINASNLADVVSYLATNTATNGTVAFAYDSDASGTADATMVFHNGTTDDLVMLVGITSGSLSATLTTTTAGTIGIA